MFLISQCKNTSKAQLYYDSVRDEFLIGNMPKGCAFGTWENIDGKWFGSSIGSGEFKPTHYMPLPNMKGK